MKTLKVLDRNEHKLKTVKAEGFKITVAKAGEYKKAEFYGDIDFTVRKKNSKDSVDIDGEEVFIAEPETLRGDFVGCVETEDGKIIRVIVKSVIPIFIYLLAGAMVLGLVFFGIKGISPNDPDSPDKPSNPFSWIVGTATPTPDGGEVVDIGDVDVPLDFIIDDGTDDWNGDLPVSGEVTEASAESTTIPGYADIILSEKVPNIQLINPTGNTVYMVYTIKNGDDVVYKSDGIGPGKMKLCDLYSLLEKGKYTLTFAISTYDVETLGVCNGANQTVEVTIK